MPDLNHWQMLAARARTGYQIIVLMALGLLAAHAQPLQPEVLADLLASPPYFGNLVLGSDGCFYGTTDNGGSSGNGTVFKVTTNGTLTTLVSFGYTNGSSPNGLTVGNDGNFYGTTYWGGASGYGTVFEITPNGGLTSLNSFTTDYAGRHPQGTLVQGSDGNLYGTTQYGPGDYGVGTIFKVTTNGTLTTLVDVSTNNGRYLNAGLTLGNDGYFYGTTWGGGANSLGNIFKVTTDGALTTIASFNNDNGSHPEAALALGSAGYFYGTANEGGSNNHGTVFQVTTNGTLTALVSFDTANGANPTAGLTLGNDGNFYGTTQWGGSSGAGTVFQVTTNGTLGTLVSFANTNGSRPNCLTVGNDGNYYGTTVSGGSYGAGVVFRLSPREPLILRQPQPASQVVPAGVSITIYASVFGALPLSYQWVRDATNLLPGAINATLMLTNVSPAMSGNYALRVTNSLGIASSSNAVLTVLPSLVATLPVSGISATGALLGGSVTLGAAETLAWFQWGSNINYGQTAGLMDIPGGSGTVLVTNALKGLDGKLIYHYRIAASNSFGTTYGVDQTFQVGLIPAAATGAATGATTNDVILNAVVNPDGRNTTAWFKWGTTTSYGHVTPATSVGSGSAPLNFSNLIAGLSWNTTYHCQIVASNNLGLALGGDSTFRFGAPLAVTEPATTLTGTKAWLVGLVAPNLFATTAWFDWGTNTSYGSAIFLGDVGRRGSALAVSNLLTGLDAALTYHFRVVASNSLGIAYGADAQINTVLYAYAQSVLADQPLVYYRFDEASGNTALNSGVLGAAGNGTYNATVALGNPSLVPVFGSAAGFNKSNSAVAVPALGTYNQLTIEAWAKPRSFGLAYFVYAALYASDNVQIEFISSSLLSVAIGATGAWAGRTELFPTNSWVHLAVTCDTVARQVITYVNGHPLATNSAYATPATLTAAYIGGWHSAYGDRDWFDGGIDEFAIYGTALPSSRIQAHYQAAIGNPMLRSAQATNKLTFSWIGPGFRPQRNPDVSNAAGWTNVPGASNSPVSITISNPGNQFYRLQWP